MKTPDTISFPIDLVYLWVDGNDPDWKNKRNKILGLLSDSSGKDCEGRYADNDELKYSLRSVEQFAPWIRQIFIITDNQVPKWLDTDNSKIKIIDHSEILPAEALPTFNSTVIEHALHNIPGLCEHFLYANDDMFFGRPVSPSDFFLHDGTPIVRFNRRSFRKLSLWLEKKILKKPISNYNLTILNSARLVENKTGRFIGHKTHHNIDAYRKSDYSHTFESFKKDILPSFDNKTRGDNDIQRNIYSYMPIVEGKAKVRFVSRKNSFRCHIDNPGNFIKLRNWNPMLFCLNDSEYASTDDRLRVKDFLEERFPEKSQFEK